MSNENKSTNDLYKKVQRRLIASLLYDSENINRVLEIVEPIDFDEPALETIFDSMAAIARLNLPVSSISVAKFLEDSGSLKKIGDVAELYLLRTEGQKYVLDAPVELYASIVKEAAVKDKLSTMLSDYKEVFKNDSGVQASDGISELQSSLNEELYKLSDESSSSKIDESYDDYIKLLEEREEIAKANVGLDGLQGIPSLLPSLNFYTTGWLPGQMITVGAKTGIGKSIMAVNCAVAAAQAGKSVLFFSLEMGSDELTDRIVSSSSGVLLSNLRHGKLTDEDKEAIARHRADFESLKIRIEAEARVTIDSIRAKSLRQAQSPDGLDFVIIDYLQLITPSGRFSSRQEAVADISRNTKLLAKQLGVPIMVLVQLNRSADKNEENPLPKLENIRESGSIGQDSDIVILLHREESMDDTIPQTLVLLEKNRSGEANKTIRCHSNLEYSLFREVTRAKDIHSEDVDRLSSDDEEAAMADFDDFDDMDLDGEELF